MFGYTLTFLLIAVIAGILGFGFIAGPAAALTKICFILFLVVSIASLLRLRTT